MHLSAAQTRVKLFPPSTCTASVVTFMGDRSRSASRPTPVGCAGVRHPVGGPRRDRCPCRIRGRGHVGQKEPEPVVVEDPLAEGRPLLCLVDGDIERRRGEARCHGRDSWATAVEGTEGNRQSPPPLGSDEAIGLEKGTVTVGTGLGPACSPIFCSGRRNSMPSAAPGARKHDMPRHPGLVRTKRE